MKNQNRTQVESAYQKRLDGIEKRLVQLHTEMEDAGFVPLDTVDWGKVGTLAHLETLLTEALAFARNCEIDELD